MNKRKSAKINIDNNLRDKRILVVGFGKSGIAAVHALIRLGVDVSIQDMKKESELDRNLITYFRNHGVTCYLHCVPDDLTIYDQLILSPGVSPELDFIQEAKANGAEVVGELEIAFRITKGNYVAITGTNGKTTTTTLVGEIFKKASRKTFVVGNIGVAVISESAVAEEGDWLVTETSSFQLETIRYFKPKISAILNFSPDHLNRHHTYQNYIDAKARIFENQREDGYLITNFEDENCRRVAEKCRAKVIWFSDQQEVETGAFVRDGRIVVKNGDGAITDICSLSDMHIIGAHNVQNVLAASAICYFAGIEPEIIGRGIREFAGVEHRLEYCAEIDGVKYYNDSKGTNTDAAVTAIKAVGENIILIAGGDAKQQNFDGFVREFPGKVKKLILLGRDAFMIQEAADKAGFTDYVVCRNMDECVKTAFEAAVPGDSVVLSPACASWDMYENFEQRGRHFKDCVRRLES